MTKADYGDCRICGTMLLHPGLDHNFCPNCGWVSDLTWTKRKPFFEKPVSTRKNK